MSIKLNSQNFQSEVLNKEVALVDFYADWCGPCKMIAPIVEEIAEENPQIPVGKVNVDDSGELAMAYNVISIPTLIVFKNGKESARIVGYRSKESILEQLL